jgi:hypothetical protein
MEQTVFDTKPLLRPAQLTDLQAEIKSAEEKMTNPGIEDKGTARKQYLRLKKNLEDQAPKPPQNGEEEGRMVSREKALLSEILEGMPSQEEMRKAPPGSVDKHMFWERKNKPKILEWKNLRLRLRPGENEAADLERYRPVGSTLSMDGAFIPGKQIYIPDEVGSTVTFSDQELSMMRKRAPELADMIGLMTNEQREKAKLMLYEKGIFKEEVKAPPKKTLSPEHLAKLLAGRKVARARKAT